MFFDTHAHINDERFNEDRPEVLARIHEAGLTGIIEIGINREQSLAAVTLADENDGIFAAIGTHPHDARTWCERDYELYCQLARNPKVVAIGEIGLDYHYDYSPREVQQRVFRTQIRLAGELGLPIVIHNRESSADLIRILTTEHMTNILFHCFFGDEILLAWGLKNNCYFGIGGPLTFKKSPLPEIILRLPLERIVLETDCPYMAPVPFRGKRNEPAYVRYVAEKLGEITGRDSAEIAQITTTNARRFFTRLPE